ncbi:energy transducer TonB [Adhaeribacter radiodurans]|uniref:TonB family protein n=1 Tax=Adhaeribacter radiodurans TaxID=2745197 RepID=A0A7L7LDB0_9BACT|nr:energy transducer TonB [Adhaeribacter radiodurans]QMU30836.1 TonB family protein [Adhaeribacter radiodurans]
MTQPDTLKWLLPDDGHFSLEQLRLYQEENLSALARHQVEKHLLDCDLCTDVLAGIAVSNRGQTQNAVNQLSQQIKSKVQSEPRLKARSFYGPALRIAAGFLILLVSFGVFRYLQRPTLTATPESSVAQQTQTKLKAEEPQVALSAPPDPIIKPTEPEPIAPVKSKVSSPTRKATVAKSIKKEKSEIALHSSAPAETLFPIDTAIVLDAMINKTADASEMASDVPLPTTIAKNSLTAKRALTGAALTGKSINSISLQSATTFTNQEQLPEAATIHYSAVKEITNGLTRTKPQMGMPAFNQYIQENLRYPAEAKRQNQEGIVEVSFTVTTEGKLTNFKILKSLHPACDAEAIRVIQEGPGWQPTQLQGQPQAENVRVTVQFKL